MNTPLYKALIQHARRNSHSFHVPGHHNGDVFFDDAKSIFDPLLTIDVTELAGLDDLHHPSGVIKEAQELVINSMKYRFMTVSLNQNCITRFTNR